MLKYPVCYDLFNTSLAGLDWRNLASLNNRVCWSSLPDDDALACLDMRNKAKSRAFKS